MNHNILNIKPHLSSDQRTGLAGVSRNYLQNKNRKMENIFDCGIFTGSPHAIFKFDFAKSESLKLEY